MEEKEKQNKRIIQKLTKMVRLLTETNKKLDELKGPLQEVANHYRINR